MKARSQPKSADFGLGRGPRCAWYRSRIEEAEGSWKKHDRRRRRIPRRPQHQPSGAAGSRPSPPHRLLLLLLSSSRRVQMGVEPAQPTPVSAAATAAEQAQDLIDVSPPKHNVSPAPSSPSYISPGSCKLRRILAPLTCQAARYDDLEDVVALFSAGVSLDSTDSQGRTGCIRF